MCNRKDHLHRKCKTHSPKFTTGKGGTQWHKKKGKASAIKKTEDGSSTSSNEVSDDESTVEVYTLKCCVKKAKTKCDKVPEIMLGVKLNGLDVNMEVDTGAAVSVIPRLLFNKLKKIGTKLHKTNVILKTITGDQIPVDGVSNVTVKVHGQKIEKMPIYVVRSEGPALFGRDCLKSVKLNWKELNINMVNLSTGKRSKLDELLHRYKEVFSNKLGKDKNIKARIWVSENARHIFFKAKTVPYALRDAVNAKLKKLESEGIIEKVEFIEWAAPIVPVRKGDGSIRLCGDFKVTVNRYVMNPEHPMPDPDELYQRLNGGKLFSKLDLSQSYQQVKLDEESRKYVTINTPLGLYRYTWLPYGISCAPQLFQTLMDQILQGIPCGCNIDDISLTGKNNDEHLHNLERVLERLED